MEVYLQAPRNRDNKMEAADAPAGKGLRVSGCSRRSCRGSFVSVHGFFLWALGGLGLD